MDTSTVAAILISLVFSVGAQAPVLSMEPRVSSVRQGESVSFRCRVTGGEQPVQLEWRKSNNQPLADNVKIGPDGSVLTIASAQPDNQGQYRCVASNAAGRTSGSAVLNVRHPPTVMLTPAGPLRVRLGEPVSIICHGVGRPRPTLKWKRQGSTLDLVTKATNDANTIEWAAVRPEDSGMYVCVAQNNEGKAEVKVELTVHGGPDAPLASLRAPLPWEHTLSGGSLTLRNVGRQDSGQYICNATNSHGYSEAFVQMEVRLRAGDTLRLQCLAHGSPPLSIQWSRTGGAALAPGAQTTQDGRLVVAQVRGADSGTYKCVASNHIGSSEAEAKVIVKKLLFMLKSVSMKECTSGRGDSSSKFLVFFFFFLILTSSWMTKSHLCAASTDVPCGPHAICEDLAGVFYCQCEPGYWNKNNKINFTATDGQCEDVHECQKNKTICSPNADCSNTIGSYTCTCHPGYAKLNPSSRMCTDIDECKSGENLNGGICGTIGNCTNTNGSFWCQCPPGYTNYGNERTPCSGLQGAVQCTQ
ncbi:hypothetical protein CRUP_007245 [Coryphaenoides rupestris]|nr:hypothetical protein CRUP_007245 [Coryphaenoides rupestris]